MSDPSSLGLIQIKAPTQCTFASVRMTYVKAARRMRGQGPRMWQPIATAPFNCDLEIAVLDQDGPHALVFACRRVPGGWTKSRTQERLDVRPTHWRPWDEHLHEVA
jgi:hypothetical protein